MVVSKTFKKAVSAVLFASAFAGTHVTAAEIYSPKAVVELFTSQGCSSCPPADKNLAKLVQNKDYLGLAFHVDYWDRLGWKDTFGDKEYTKRQRNYSYAMNERQIYTPQAVINGRNHVVGSRGSDIKSLAKQFEKTGQGMSVPINVVEHNGKLDVSIAAQDGLENATLYAVYFQPTAKVSIKSGELAGKTLNYTNIVRKIEMLGMSNASGMKIAFSIKDLKAKGYEGCALILQSKVNGFPSAILGASVISDL